MKLQSAVVLATFCCLLATTLCSSAHSTGYNECQRTHRTQEHPLVFSPPYYGVKDYFFDNFFDQPFFQFNSLQDIFGKSWDPWDPFWLINIPARKADCAKHKQKQLNGRSEAASTEKIPVKPEFKAELDRWEQQKLEEWDKRQKSEQEIWEREQQEAREIFRQELEEKKQQRLKEQKLRQLQLEKEAVLRKQKLVEREALMRNRQSNFDHQSVSTKGEEQSPNQYNRQTQLGKRSEIVTILVPGYKDSELDISIKGREVKVKGHHECSCDEGCLVSQFERTYHVPRNIDPSTVSATLSKGGSLQITGQKWQQGEHYDQGQTVIERTVPVHNNGVPETVSDQTKCRMNTSNPGISLAKQNQRTGKVFIARDSDIQDQQYEPLRTKSSANDDEDDGVTIEVVQYDE